MPCRADHGVFNLSKTQSKQVPGQLYPTWQRTKWNIVELISVSHGRSWKPGMVIQSVNICDILYCGTIVKLWYGSMAKYHKHTQANQAKGQCQNRAVSRQSKTDRGCFILGRKAKESTNASIVKRVELLYLNSKHLQTAFRYSHLPTRSTKRALTVVLNIQNNAEPCRTI